MTTHKPSRVCERARLIISFLQTKDCFNLAKKNEVLGREQTVKFNSNSMQLDTSVFTDFSAQVSETPVLDLVSHFDPSGGMYLLQSVFADFSERTGCCDLVQHQGCH